MNTSIKMQPYWLDTATPVGDFTDTQLPRRVDLAVVGAGFTGLSTAYHAAKSGLTVAVLEANTVMWGASGRNGGMSTNGLGIGFTSAIKRFGEQKAREYIDLYSDAVEVIEQIVTENNLDVDFGRRGKLILAAKESHIPGLHRTKDALERVAGHRVHLIEGDELRSEIGSDAFPAAIVEQDSADLHVAKFGFELARLALQHGATIHERAAVTHVRRLGRGTAHELTTPRGKIHAEKVVVGTSGYTGKPFGWMQRRVMPVGSFIVGTEPLSDELVRELIPNRRTCSDTKNLLNYFRLSPDNRLLFGGRAQFALSNPENDKKSGEILVKRMREIYPQLHDTRIDYMWGGLVDISMDRMVHAGMHNGLYYSMGYSGHGVQMATYMGRAMASVVQGNDSANPWRDLKNPWVPFYFGKPGLHLRIGGAWYANKDRKN